MCLFSIVNMLVRLLKQLLNKPKPVEAKPTNQTITQTKAIMSPLSTERLSWLHHRQTVLEPVINKLKLYVTHRSLALPESAVLTSLTTTQAEFISNLAEIEVLQDHFEAMEKQRKSTDN